MYVWMDGSHSVKNAAVFNESRVRRLVLMLKNTLWVSTESQAVMCHIFSSAPSSAVIWHSRQVRAENTGTFSSPDDWDTLNKIKVRICDVLMFYSYLTYITHLSFVAIYLLFQLCGLLPLMEICGRRQMQMNSSVHVPYGWLALVGICTSIRSVQFCTF